MIDGESKVHVPTMVIGFVAAVQRLMSSRPGWRDVVTVSRNRVARRCSHIVIGLGDGRYKINCGHSPTEVHFIPRAKLRRLLNSGVFCQSAVHNH